jgi:hypothetical protein
MAKQRKLTLCVEADGRRRYISVSAGRASDLHHYLRSHGVGSAPPEPASTGFDNIKLAHDIDVDEVQTLLNAWI